MKVQILKQEIKDAILKDRYLKADLATVNDVSFWTLDQWRLKDSPMLTTATNLTIIRKRLSLDKNAVLTEEVDFVEQD